MKDQESSELLSRVLDGHANAEQKARLLAWIRENKDERGEVAEQIGIDGLLGVALENNDGLDFQQRLKDRLLVEEKRSLSRRIRVGLHAHMRKLALVLGPLLAALAWLGTNLLVDFPAGHDPAHASWAAAVLVLCAVWWIFEPIPIGATSLIPLAVFPLAGVMDERELASSYGSHLVILFLTGFMLSRTMESCGAHRRLAFGMLKLIGASSERRLVLGFMVTSACISMWVANTVTVLMLLPVALAVIDQSRGRRLGSPLLLGIAYAAAFGGMGTPVGTPPNGILTAQSELLVSQGILNKPFGFIDWMKVGLPVNLIMIPLAWLWLTRGRWHKAPIRFTPVGAWTKAEVRVSVVLGLTALLWMTRADPFGGWSTLLGMPSVQDSSVGLLAVLAMVLIPSGDGRSKTLLDWERAMDVPWSILILLGGGIAIGNAFESTGLSRAVVGNLHLLDGLPVFLKVAAVVLVVSFVTEFNSNTATATVLMPLLAATAVTSGMSPVLLMLSATLANSCSFMLPIGTPPNAIVFAVGDFPLRRMFWEGLVLKLFSVLVITVVCYLVAG